MEIQKEGILLSQDVIIKLEKISSNYQQLMLDMGVNEVNLLRLTNKKTEIVNSISKLQEEESKYHEVLLERFGKGNIDIEKKMFFPE